VVNGIASVPVMAMMMLMSARRDVMGKFRVRGPLQWLGWLTTLVMAATVVAMILLSI
jgi:Mn2+/Fe2+ NRAMP family transporter